MIHAYGPDRFRVASSVTHSNGTPWCEEAKRVGSRSGGDDFFAASVAVRGERVFAGAP